MAVVLAALRRFLEGLRDRVAPMRVAVTVVVVDGSPDESGLAFTMTRKAASQFYDDTGVVLRFDIQEGQGFLPGPHLRTAYNTGNYQPPTIFVFPRVARIDGAALGVAYGEYIAIAGEGQHLSWVYLHELGHWFGLQHEPDTFVQEPGAPGPVTERQRQVIRGRARFV